MITPEQKMANLLKLIGNPAVCGSETIAGCGAPILWAATKNGGKMPLNPDGTVHWQNCPHARNFRKRS